MRIHTTILLMLIATITVAQKKVLKSIDEEITGNAAGSHIQFLASDELRGRNTGSPEIDIAARYIAAQFKLASIKPAPGMKDYFQNVDLMKAYGPDVIDLQIDTAHFGPKQNLLYAGGPSINSSAELVFIGYGTPEDFAREDLKGKIAVTYAGQEGGEPNVVEALLNQSPEKAALAKSKGAVGLIEISNYPLAMWQRAQRYMGLERYQLGNNTQDITHLWLKNSDHATIKRLIDSKRVQGRVTINVKQPQQIHGRNVIGVVEGTDNALKNEWIVVSAHYDHVGVKKGAGADSIFNGARDNAIGTAAVIESAKYFRQHPTKRSIMFIAFTAEEVGLLGSEWYAQHPLIPLKQTIFNLNCDGAGYNDTTLVTIVDMNRITTDQTLAIAAQSQGLTLKGDPAPEQKLYDRSDNVNFAKRGVPAINISPGVREFTQELFKYYHQPADEFESLNMFYLAKFYKSFVYAIYLLSADPTKPAWKPGDKYEQAGKKLYGL